MHCPRILMTPGEPAGVGPDLVVQIAKGHYPAELVVIADPELLQSRAAKLGVPLQLNHFDPSEKAFENAPNSLKIIPILLRKAVIPGELDPANASYVIQSLEIASDLCLKKTVDALVTGPVQKSIITEIEFTGHTEFLSARAEVATVIMLFVTDKMKVALATTHLPLKDVSANITSEKLINILRLLSSELQNKFHIKRPKILVTGLNPHAGESGRLGKEEIEIISPALKFLQNEGLDVQGPLPADTLFTEKYLASADAILAMYHDQALPVVKFQGFGQAVNVTLGLPYIRTSVDHGTALDVAGTSKADAGSLMAAIDLAIKLAR